MEITDCCSYEYSPDRQMCNLNKECEPQEGKYADFLFCKKLKHETQGKVNITRDVLLAQVSNVNDFISARLIAQVDKCALPLKQGPCEAYFPMWGFDKEMNACRKFIYGGCDGNANQFSSKEECMKYCDTSKAEESHLGY